MRKMYYSIIMMSMFIFVVWLLMLAIYNNFDLSHVRINLFASVKRFESASSDDWVSYVKTVSYYFSTLDFVFDFDYVQVNSLATFFQNIGVWFNGVWSLFVEFFKLLGNVIRTLGLGIAYICRLVINIFNFIFTPVQL